MALVMRASVRETLPFSASTERIKPARINRLVVHRFSQ
jgi:hypothetical protein